MKRLGVQLLSMLLAGMLLVSFAGMRLLTHHCFTCESTDVIMAGFSQDDRFDDIHHHHHERNDCPENHLGGDLTCCDDFEKGHDCHCGDNCESEIHYLRAEYDASSDRSPEKIVSPEFVLLSAFVISMPKVEEMPLSLPFISVSDPPPKPAGRELVIFSCRLKYC